MLSSATLDCQKLRYSGFVIQVYLRRLRDWIDGPIDLLKLDIEGAEYDVFEDIEDKFHLVRRIVCEVHVDATNQALFGQLVTRLAEHGFVSEISRAWYFSLSEYLGHPLEDAGRPYSLTLWARQRQDVNP
ncbi:FkbM family methyltransferase [Ruegeria lacuscaerulensis]|uniref:FkbM family methyltransferase n=1 Tax=Ruegeria lacuscaerulensis TaxID=55218 RepID=UPI00147AC576